MAMLTTVSRRSGFLLERTEMSRSRLRLCAVELEVGRSEDRFNKISTASSAESHPGLPVYLRAIEIPILQRKKRPVKTPSPLVISQDLATRAVSRRRLGEITRDRTDGWHRRSAPLRLQWREEGAPVMPTSEGIDPKR